MKLALCSDEPYPIHDDLVAFLEDRGIEWEPFGSFLSGKDEPWVESTSAAAKSILSNECQEGIFFCWTGTGASIAANKFQGIRAALCTDPETATGSRVWNHSNVLCLSNRLMSRERMIEIVAAWLAPGYDKEAGASGIEELKGLESQQYR